MSSYYASPEEESEAMGTFLRNRRRAAGTGPSEEELDRLVANRLQTRQIETSVLTLSQVVAELGVERIDLLKIDVEKAELDVLLGVNDGDWRRIDRLLMEVHDLDGRLSAIEGMLRERGDRV